MEFLPYTFVCVRDQLDLGSAVDELQDRIFLSWQCIVGFKHHSVHGEATLTRVAEQLRGYVLRHT